LVRPQILLGSTYSLAYHVPGTFSGLMMLVAVLQPVLKNKYHYRTWQMLPEIFFTLLREPHKL